MVDLWRYWIEHRTETFEGFLSVLWWNEKPAAIAFSLRHQCYTHCCFISYDSQFAKYSRDLILLLEMSAALANEGTQELHMGRGHERFKTSLATHAHEVAEGVNWLQPLGKHKWLQTWYLSRQRMKQSAALRWLRSLQLLRDPSTAPFFPSLRKARERHESKDALDRHSIVRGRFALAWHRMRPRRFF